MTEPGDWLKQAETANRQGDRKSAIEFATEVLRREPGNRKALELIGSEAVPGEHRRLAILFCDLVGSTSLSARMSVDSYRRLVQDYQREAEAEIVANGGSVTRRVGDGILAVFGYPLTHEDDAFRAVRAGLAIVARIDAGHDRWLAEFGEGPTVRIGIHLGRVHLDLIDQELFGLAPNLAARLQGLADPGEVIISDEVLDLVGPRFRTEPREPVPVRGIDQPVPHHVVRAEVRRTPDLGRSWTTPYVGRSEEQRTVTQVVAGSGDDGVAGVVVRGEPGAGKSRLVSEVIEATRSPERLLLRTIGNEYEQTDEFGAATAMLRSTAGGWTRGTVSVRLSELRAHLDRLGLDPEAIIPVLGLLLGIPAEAGFDRAEADLTRIHDQILSALREWLTAVARTKPILIYVDDVQWIDASSCALLNSLVAQPIPGVRLVCTERTGSHRVSGSALVTVELGALSGDEARTLTEQLWNDTDPDRIDEVVSRAQGNPLFVVELARFATMDSVVEPGLMASVRKDSAVPASLYEPLLARLYADGTDIRLAQLGATIGRSFDLSLLAEVSHRSAEAVASGVQTLIDADLVETDTDPPGARRSTHWFRHVLIRDIAYDLMPEDERMETHGRVGDALRDARSGDNPTPWSTIATHFRAGGRTNDAIEAYEGAADEARERGALDQGAEHLGAAIELLDHLDDEPSIRLREADLRLKRGFLHVSRYGNADPRAIVDYDRCLEITRTHEFGDEFTSTMVALWGYHVSKGDLDRADELLAIIRDTAITDDPVMSAQNHTAQGMVRWFQGDFLGAEAELLAGMAEVPDPLSVDTPMSPWQFPNDPTATAAVVFALTMWQRGIVDEFHQLMRWARERTAQLPFPHGPFSEAYRLLYDVMGRMEMGLHVRAAASSKQLLEIGERYGFTFWSIAGTMTEAATKMRSELSSVRPDAEVIAECAQGLSGVVAIQKMADAQLLLPFALTLQAEAGIALGDPDHAVARLDEATSVAERTGAGYYQAETLRHRGLARLSGGDESGLDDLELAGSLARRQGSVAFEIRGLDDLVEIGARPPDDPRLVELLRGPTARAASGRIARIGAEVPADVGAHGG